MILIKFLKESQEEIPEDELHLLITEVDTNKNGLIELDEVILFLKMYYQII